MTHLGPYALDSIITGDARELAKAIPDESVDLIFTDPVYDRIDDYRWLAETAARVLKPGGACLVFNGIEWITETLLALGTSLRYRWQFSTFLTGGSSSRFHPFGFAKWYSCLWFEKGTTSLSSHFVDAQVSTFMQSNGHHEWSKSPAVLKHWINAFTDPAAIVWDPFTGGGTVPAVCKMLRRHYLAFEIDPDTAERARQRVLTTQAPLVFPEPEQLVLDHVH